MNPATSSPAELTFYFYPSPGIDWSTPGSLIRTAGLHKALSRSRAIGHVSIQVKCGGSRPVSFHTGMTQLRPREGKRHVLLQGYGLGMLFHDFAGVLETSEKLDAEIAGRARETGRLSFLRFHISEATAHRLEEFLQEFHACGADQHYGLPFRPLYREGAGCSAFAAGFLEVAGLLDDEFKQNWTRLMRIPTRLLGGPLTGRWISPLRLFGTKSWAKDGEDQREIFFWDPDLMHEWTMREHQKALSSQSAYRAERWENALGLSIDRVDVPTPTAPLFKV